MSGLALQSFGFGDQLVRVMDRNGGAWFVANDVCGALEISNPRDAVRRLEDDERDDVGITDAIGRNQVTTIISESGVYSLIFKSRKPCAVAFRRWVTGQVLPTIRETGRFEVSTPPPIEPVPVDALDFVDRVRAGLQMVREARIIFGLSAARRAWTLAGLPDVSDDGTVAARHLDAKVQSVAKWFAERVEIQSGTRESAARLYMDYARWCDEGEESPVNMTQFGRTMGDLGIEKIRNSNVFYVSVQLKP